MPAPDGTSDQADYPGDAPADTVPAVVRPRAVDLEGLALVDSAALDLDGDGSEERIELRVQAERLPDGRVLWEDGHRWVVVVREGGGSNGRAFPLLDAFVPHGTVRFRLVERWDEASGTGPDRESAESDGDPGEPPEPGAGGISVVIAVESSTGGVWVTEWRFDPGEGGYVGVSRLRVEGRLIHRTPEGAFR